MAVEGTVIIPPVHIAPSATVNHCVVGPNVSIGEGAKLDRVVATNTIIGPGATVSDIQLSDTLIGHEAVVRGTSSKLNVGDLSEITA
jgi:glucose-1-phosphate thymidylyltransferase